MTDAKAMIADAEHRECTLMCGSRTIESVADLCHVCLAHDLAVLLEKMFHTNEGYQNWNREAAKKNRKMMNECLTLRSRIAELEYVMAEQRRRMVRWGKSVEEIDGVLYGD